jgi:phage terminase large subunit-like protein
VSLLDADPELLRQALTTGPPERRALVARAIVDRYFPNARPAQIPPDGDWQTWMLRAGRGFGKTRSGAEWIVNEGLEHVGSYAVAAPTFADGRDICIEGESGVQAVLERRHRRSTWNRSLGEVRLDNGSRLKVGSADEPDRFRGWNFAGAWLDELAAWRRPDAFTQIRLATRLGRARIVVTTTPRPTKLVRDLLDAPSTVVASGSTFDNAANLTQAALDELLRQYEGTRIGRQELYGELLLDTPGALWTPAMVEAPRCDPGTIDVADMDRVVVAVDPAVTSGEDADETGIIGAGRRGDEFYVFADRSCRRTPNEWAAVVCQLHDELAGDRIVAEVNNGGDLVATVLRAADPSVPVRKVSASRGKRVRAEPVAALYEQGRVHHVGSFPELEDQMLSWTPDSPHSPDRLDALVWAITDLAGLGGGHGRRRRGVVAR